MGLPSAIWGGRRAAPAIGHPVAERLPEIDVQQRPLSWARGSRYRRVQHQNQTSAPIAGASSHSQPTEIAAQPARHTLYCVRSPRHVSHLTALSLTPSMLPPLCALRTRAAVSPRAPLVRGSVPPRRIAPKREPSLHPSDLAPLPRLGTAHKKHSSPHHHRGPPSRL
jgi:hypothetical protein